MRELTRFEIEVGVSGGTPKFLNVISGAVWGAITGLLLGGGPPGAAAGAFYGASIAIAKEGTQELSEILHPKLFDN